MSGHIFLILPLICLLSRQVQSYPFTQVACDARLETSISTGRTETRIQCVNVGIDGQPLDVVLANTPFFDTKTDQVFNFDEIANTVTSLEVSARGSVTISKNGLSKIPNLAYLNIDSESRRRDHLTISPMEFKNTPHLTSLHIGGFTVDNTTILAIGGLKQKLESLGVHDCAPGKKILKQVEKFTNLKYNVEFSYVCDDGIFPVSTLQNSATTIRSIRIEFCNLPRITKQMFKGMKNLTYLQLSSSKVSEIESGAFDDLESLKYLNLNGNRVREVPSGFFANMKNLLVIDLAKNHMENVSKKNFTQCLYYDQLQLII